MNRKRFFALITSFALMATLAAPISAMTSTEMQEMIEALNAQIALLQQQLANLSGGSTTTPSFTGIPASFTFTRNLRLGSSGDDVKYLQIILNSDPDTRLRESGVGAPGQETSYFGPLTEAAVIKFQNKYATTVLHPLSLTNGTGFVGSSTRTKLNAILVEATEPEVVLPPVDDDDDDEPSVPAAAPMTVSLAADTPTSANLWRGSANNVVAKFTFNGGSAPVNVSGLTLRSYGTTEATGTTDITAVKILDENNVQVGTDRTVAGNLVNFVFVPSVSIPANSSRTLSVAVNVGTGATVMSQARYGIESASSVSGGVFTGTFPVVGESFTIIPAGSSGSVSVADYGNVPLTSVKIGQKDVVLERFTVSAGSNEDVIISQIAVTNAAAATISDNDISNLRIREVGGQEVAGPANLLNRKATFNLTTPISLTKGTAKNFELIGDIVSGNSRDVRINLAAGAVVAEGVSSGISLVSSGSSTSTTITIGTGQLVVSMSGSHPVGASASVVQNSTRKTLAAFDVRSLGEDVILNSIDLKFNANPDIAGAKPLISVGLYDGDALVSNLQDVSDENDATFSLNWTIPAGTAKTLYVRGIDSSLDASGGSATLITTWSGYDGYGLSSGVALKSTADVSALGITVYAAGDATLAASTTKTPHNQAIRVPSNGVTLAALRVYAVREDSKLTNLIITTSHADKVSGLTIHAEDGTTLSVPVAESGQKFTFDATHLLQDIVFAKGEYTTLLLKGNVIAAQADYTLSIANTDDHFIAVGVNSSSQISKKNLPFAISSPHSGGTFTFTDKVIEMEKDATSPSGSVSRATQTVTGVWTLTNEDASAADATITAIKFTSKTGLPSGLTDGVDGGGDAALFSLYDGDGNKISVDADRDLVKANGTIEFHTLGTNLVVSAGQPKTLKLVVNTTDTSIWPSNTQIQWTLAAYADATVTDGGVGYAGSVWSIPADANIVSLP